MSETKAQPIKSDERDQRVKELLTAKKLDGRLSLIHSWMVSGAIDRKGFLDLVKIATHHANLKEVARDLRKLANTSCKRHPDQAVEAKQFAKLCESLPGITSKLEGVASDG
jgi:hypothetical protein